MCASVKLVDEVNVFHWQVDSRGKSASLSNMISNSQYSGGDLALNDVVKILRNERPRIWMLHDPIRRMYREQLLLQIG